jgi:hypothetical protein
VNCDQITTSCTQLVFSLLKAKYHQHSPAKKSTKEVNFSLIYTWHSSWNGNAPRVPNEIENWEEKQGRRVTLAYMS